MIVVRFIHTILLYLIVVVSFFIGTGIMLCFVPFAKKKHIPFLVAAHLWAQGLAFLSGIKVKTRGFENIPEHQPVIFVANHQGAMDVPILLSNLPVLFRFAIKKELFKLPIFGWYLRRAGYFAIDRELILSAYKMVEKIIDILKSGESVMIFPEGTRSRDGTLGKFKRGSLMAALKAGVPIIPLAIAGSYNIMPRGTWLINPARVSLSAGKPIYINGEDEYNQKVEEVRTAIAELLKERP